MYITKSFTPHHRLLGRCFLPDIPKYIRYVSPPLLFPPKIHNFRDMSGSNRQLCCYCCALRLPFFVCGGYSSITRHCNCVRVRKSKININQPRSWLTVCFHFVVCDMHTGLMAWERANKRKCGCNFARHWDFRKINWFIICVVCVCVCRCVCSCEGE